MTDPIPLTIHSHLPRIYTVCPQSPLSNLLLHKLLISLLVKSKLMKFWKLQSSCIWRHA